jgi:hypothetical protein
MLNKSEEEKSEEMNDTIKQALTSPVAIVYTTVTK